MKYEVSFEGKPTSPVIVTISMTTTEWQEFKKLEVAEAIEKHAMAKAVAREKEAEHWKHPDVALYAAGWPCGEAVEGMPGTV